MSGSDKPSSFGVYKSKEMIHDILLQTGQKDLFMTHIRHKTTQQGWTWAMRDEFMDYIRKRGSQNVNVSHMISDLAPLGRELFPEDLRKELLESMFEVTKGYFTIDDSITPNIDPDNPNSEADKTFLYQSRDVKPDPGLGIGLDIPESPQPSPQSSPSSASTPRQSPGPVVTGNSGTGTRQSPSTPRQSPSTAPRQSPISSSARPLTPQPLPPPPVLRPEMVSIKSEPVVAPEDDEEQEEEDEDEEEEEEEDVRNNEEDEEDELMDV